MSQPSKQGGKRAGAGRKPKFDEPTVTISIRVPKSRADEFMALLESKLQEIQNSKK